MTLSRGVGPASLAALLLVGTATAASAEPPWQFPWPNSQDADNDDEWGVSGFTYECGTHMAAGPGSINNPGAWDRNAIDFAKVPGTTFGSQVAAAADGLIAKEVQGASGFGNYAILDHGGFYTIYAHLDSFSGWVDVGDRVRAGEEFGEAGWSGLGGPGDTHLHFQTARGPTRRSMPTSRST